MFGNSQAHPRHYRMGADGLEAYMGLQIKALMFDNIKVMYDSG